MLTASLLLMCSILSASPVDIYTAPELPAVDTNLPKSVTIPADKQQCLADGTWLPAPRDRATADFVAACVVYPPRCQARIDAVRKAGDSRWPAWAVVVVSVGVMVLGGLAGYGVAAATR